MDISIYTTELRGLALTKFIESKDLLNSLEVVLELKNREYEKGLTYLTNQYNGRLSVIYDLEQAFK